MRAIFENVKITSIATCVPNTKINLHDFSEKYNFSDVDRVCKTTGIFNIRVASEEITSSDLCLKAANVIFDDNPMLKDEIDGILFVSQTADYKLPQTSHIIQDKLGLKIDTICFDFPIGCNGYIYGIFQASLLVTSGACKKVLLLAGDTNSKLINERDRAVKLVFGDAGSATLIEKSEESSKISVIIKSDGSGYEDLIIPSGGYRNRFSINSLEEYQDNDGNIRSACDLYMDGMAIFNFAIKCVPDIIHEAINFSNWVKSDIDLFAIHQANKFMVDYIRKKVGVDETKMPVVIEGFGNTGPTSIPLLLTEINSIKEKQKMEKVILCGFGVGLSWGTVTCNLSETQIFKTITY